jgi:hypothetical protein
MAPAGASLASFQGSRYTGSSSVTPHGDYWLRQMGLDGSKVTALLVATNVGCFGMQQLSTTFTSYCVRVGCGVLQAQIVCSCVGMIEVHGSGRTHGMLGQLHVQRL